MSLSLNSCSAIRENTIASMKNAVLHGADMIEFDVQLSKDMIPVIYHDFEACLPSTTKNGENHLVEIPLKTLTLEQLHHLRVSKTLLGNNQRRYNFSKSHFYTGT